MHKGVWEWQKALCSKSTHKMRAETIFCLLQNSSSTHIMVPSRQSILNKGLDSGWQSPSEWGSTSSYKRTEARRSTLGPDLNWSLKKKKKGHRDWKYKLTGTFVSDLSVSINILNVHSFWLSNSNFWYLPVCIYVHFQEHTLCDSKRKKYKQTSTDKLLNKL